MAADTVALVGVGIGVIALVVAIITAYFNKRAIPPEAKAPDLTVDVTVTPLLPRGNTDVRAKLRILYEGGGQLSDPRLVQVVLHNTGTAAISEDMYDGVARASSMSALAISLTVIVVGGAIISLTSLLSGWGGSPATPPPTTPTVTATVTVTPTSPSGR